LTYLLPDPFPWSAVANGVLTVFLSFGGFVIGIRAGKNNLDRSYLRDIYKAIYSHFREMKESIVSGKPMQWDDFRTQGNKYIPLVKELELDGTINALPEALAKALLEVEQTTLFNNWQWKKMIEDIVGPQIQSAFRDRISGDGKSLQNRPYRQIRLSSLMLLNATQLEDLCKGLVTGDVGVEIELALVGSKTNTLHAYPETLKVGSLDKLVKDMRELALSSDEAKGLARIHTTKMAEIDELMALVGKRIKDPHPFWSSVRQAVRDPFN
jgi:hypothetical protein